MQNKLLLLLSLLFTSLFGKDVFDKNSDSEIYFLSSEVGIEGDNIVAYKNATALYRDKYMRADTIIYNQKTKDIEFFGDVSLVERGLYFFVGDYAKIFLDGNSTIRNMFLYHKPRHIWLYSNESKSTEDKFILKNTFLSSCRSEDPDWGFYIQSGEYYKKEQFFELYNVILYATDIPVFYLPYLNFSTSRQRKSGLLIPEFGISSTEGFFFAQPFYYVPNDWSDLEFIPQVRTDRGNGAYLTYRFADSINSRGSITAGYFQEHQDYYSENNLAHKEKYGFQAEYKSSSIFNKADDSLFIDLTYLNDIAYLYLKQYKRSGNELTNLIESKLNYFISKGNHSLGFYNRYVIDTSKTDNDETLQTLPQVQYHYGLDSIFNNILYSFNYSYENLTRTKGATANQHEVIIPITLYWSFFDNFMGFKITENFYSSYIEFGNIEEEKFDESFYIRHYHQIEIFTDLAKKYRSGIFHSMNFGANFILPDIESKSGFYSPESSTENCAIGEVCEFQREDKIDSTLELKFSQYIHNSSGQELFFHKIFQPVIVDNGKVINLDILNNEFKYRFTEALSFYNNLNFSFERDVFTKLSSTLEFKKKDYKFDLSHFKKIDNNISENMNFVSTGLSLKVSDKYSIFGHYAYNILDDSTRSWGVGYDMKKRCWNYRLYYKEEYRPVLTNSGVNSDKENMLYFLIELYPLGGFEYEVR